MERTTGRGAYRAVCDILVRHRDYDGPVAAFRWRDIGGRFNWALDWFDSAAAGNPRTLRISCASSVSDDSFAEMVAIRSGHRRRDLRPCPPQPCALPGHPEDRIHEATRDDLRQDPARRSAGSRKLLRTKRFGG
jgi:hypothetical protein